MIKLVCISLVLMVGHLTSSPLNAPQSFESLLCKEWKLNYFEEDGRKELPDAAEQNDRMTFHTDHTAEFIEARESKDGIWQYDPANKKLVILDRVTKEKMTMKIISITKIELVLVFMDGENEDSKVHLMAVK